ncbi:DMT family transporter [Sporomusa acidovorans]|uniref:EamA domain-containing protein n=1 Tax=Sporomusa acidovorans (strain ATCC 49682 / DSM 3132 / Mol) TaxID=1123286 RepID=A0ABZ3J1C9_SPOA4|nr:DMT family transporter [Sporomusa acidovorans]OZC22537.1 putative amino-acid metabolite efflux pump [Sporomusa acidovorans DSM 3132]SDE72670.1 EamA-like transporter family protein [Sporomusa acidovorans]
MRQGFKGAFYLSLAASIWGGLYVVSKYAMEIVPPFTLLFFRYVVASATLSIACRIVNAPIFPAVKRTSLLQVGFIGYFLSISAQFIGTNLSSAHMGAVITTLSPIFQSIFAILLLKETMSRREGMAMFIAFAGVLIIILTGGDNSDSTLWGNLILLLAAVFWGYQSVIARQASFIHSPLTVTTAGALVAAFFTGLAALTELGQWNYLAITTWSIVLSILYIGVVSTAVAFFAWNKGLSLLSTHQAGPFFFFQPVVGSLLGWAMLGEQLTIAFFCGTILIIIGVYYSFKCN